MKELKVDEDRYRKKIDMEKGKISSLNDTKNSKKAEMSEIKKEIAIVQEEVMNLKKKVDSLESLCIKIEYGLESKNMERHNFLLQAKVRLIFF